MPRFDYKGAKAAGYSDDDIAKFLAQQRASGQDLFIQKSDLIPEAPAKLSLMAAFNEAGRRNLKLLPSIGGTIGQVMGGSPGAAIGGGIAEAVRQPLATLQSYPNPPEDSATPGDVLKQAAIQGGLGKAGDLITAGVRGGANLVMRSALGRSTAQVAEKAIAKGIPATQAGLKKVSNLLGLSGDAARIAAHKATQGGMVVSRDQLADEVLKSVGPTIEENAIKTPGRNLLTKIDDLFRSDNPAALTPSELHEMKVRADKIADPIYKAMGRGDPISSRAFARATWYKTLADKIRDRLVSVPGYKEATTESAALIGVKQGVRKATRAMPLAERLAGRSVPAVIGGVIGAGAPANTYQERAVHGGEGALLGAALTTPSVASMLALLASNPMLLRLLSGTPRAVEALREGTK